MDTFTRVVLRHGRAVIVCWLLAACIAATFAMRLPSVIHGSTDAIRESESGEVTQAIDDNFGKGAGYLLTVVVDNNDTQVSDPCYVAAVDQIADVLSAVSGVRSVRHYWNTGAPELLGGNGTSALLLVQTSVGSFFEAEDLTGPLRAALRDGRLSPGFSAIVTGTPAMFHDLTRNSSADLLKAERIGIPLTLLILLIVFRAPLAAALPLVLAFVAVTISSAGLYFLSRWLPMSVFAQNVVSMVGLGVGVDYALFTVSRFRAHLARGQSVREAAHGAALATGPAILVSGIAVGIGFLALLLVRARFLHSIALGGLLVVAVAVLATVTLLPVLMQFLGTALNWPHRFAPAVGADAKSGSWARWASRVMQRPWSYAVAALVVLALLIVPALRMVQRNASMDDIPLEFEARQGFEQLQKNFVGGSMGPVVLLVQSRPGRNLHEETSHDAVVALASRLVADPGVATGSIAREVISGDGKTALITVLPKSAPERPETIELVKRLRADRWPEASDGGFTVKVGGTTAMILDFDAELFGSLWRVIPAVLTVTFVVLLVAFRSVLIPVKAVLMNLLSVLAAYGFLVLVFQDGIGASILGIDPPGGLNSLVVLMLFTILFGLSMDYEIFLLQQVQEEYRRSGDNRGAVASGLERSGRLITSAALIMVCLFGSFAATQLTATREFGLGLAFAVALDATVIRLLLVPALMELFGAANWWLPAPRSWQRPIRLESTVS